MVSVKPLLKAIELSEKILLAIDNEDWDEINRLDHQRSQVIEEYFNHTVEIDKKLTQNLKQLNDTIVTRLVQIQQNNRSRQITLTHAQKASKAYLENIY